VKYYLIAGEASGDIHGANLMKAILLNDAKAEFRFWGGDKMKIIGGEQVEHYKNTAYMGFLEVIKNLRTILSFIKTCKADIIDWNPDILILIDYPGFNMRIAKFAKKKGFKIVYYISPQVWAWKEKRVEKIKMYVDKMLVILPFEKPFYEDKWNYQVDFVGHPLLDEIEFNNEYKLQLNNNEKQVIAILPGSREQEINKILPEFLKITKYFPDYHFVIAGIPHLGNEYYNKFTTDKNIEIIFGKTYHLLNQSYAALVASGTATLESALFNTPMIVGYKGSWISYQIGKRLVKSIKYISLVNLIMDKEIVKELIQEDLNEVNIKKELTNLLTLSTQYTIRQNFTRLKSKLGSIGASKKSARIINDLISTNPEQ
jgi:lipid-A-disaccharide synthase